MGYRYYCSCVGWPREDVDAEGGLSDMICGAIMLSRRAFLKHVDRESLVDIEEQLGYESHPRRGLTMAGDWHVTYHRSKLHGKRVYFFRWSGIEHVFVEAADDPT